jgi:AbrB family looped-hinge helix DNA binding protein
LVVRYKFSQSNIQKSNTYHTQDLQATGGLKATLTVVTRKGQITLPVAIRQSLGIKEGDKIAVSLTKNPEGQQDQMLLKPVSSVAEMTYGAVAQRVSGKPPADFKDVQRAFEEGVAQEVIAETPLKE